MQKTITLLAALVLVAGLAVGQDEAYNADGNTAAVTQDITLNIPERYALHLSEVSWDLDLGNVTPGQIDEQTGLIQGCFMVPTYPEEEALNVSDFTAEDWVDAYDSGAIIPHGNYPAAQFEDGDMIRKGTLVCFKEKILQKFANTNWQLDVTVSDPDSNANDFGVFGISDFAAIDATTAVGATGDITSTDLPVTAKLHEGNGSTGGWLDDYVVEGFHFDGTEVAQEDTTIKVVYSLSAP